MSLKVVLSDYRMGIMPNNRVIMSIEGNPTSIINTPYFPQGQDDALCYVCSLKMIVEYFKGYYPNQRINDGVPNLTIAEIKRITKTRDASGTREDNLISYLKEAIPTLNFELVKDGNFDMIKELIDKDLPVIVLYSGDYLKNKEKGGGHAGVIIGMTDDKIIMNNPWFGLKFYCDKRDFQDAWDLEIRAFIKITPNDQTLIKDFKVGDVDAVQNN